MTLRNDLRNIKKILLERYKNNLAAILVFGSANTGQFIDGESDIDTIILLKNPGDLDLEREKKFLSKKAELINWSIIHFRTLKDYKNHIYNEGSWSSWITTINGSKRIYSTSEFEKFRRELIKNPVPRKKLFKYLKNKDRFELTKMKRLGGWNSTKWAFSHIRRKLQILNYFKTEKLIFDYDACVYNLNPDDKQELNQLCQKYKQREKLSKKEINYYYNLARELTKMLHS